MTNKKKKVFICKYFPLYLPHVKSNKNTYLAVVNSSFRRKII